MRQIESFDRGQGSQHLKKNVIVRIHRSDWRRVDGQSYRFGRNQIRQDR